MEIKWHELEIVCPQCAKACSPTHIMFNASGQVAIQVTCTDCSIEPVNIVDFATMVAFCYGADQEKNETVTMMAHNTVQ